MRKPLEGIKVLDLTLSAAGSLCTLLLCDYGAEVIKAEKTKAQCDTVTEEEKCARATFHRGKKPVFMDLDDERGREVFWNLCRKADAVVENFRPETMEKWGLTYEAMKRVNPAVVYTSISGYGQDGPYAGRGASDAVIQAESGIMSITGPRGKESVKCGANISSYMSAMTGCIGTLTALISAKRTGEGRRVDVSMMDTTMLCLENQLAVYLRDGIVPKPMGNSYDLFAPVGLYTSRDHKEFMLSVGTDRQWNVLCRALKRPEWIQDPRYVTNMRRVEHLAELNQELTEEFQKYDRADLAEILQSWNCVYGNINDFQAVAEHPQIAERGMIVRASYPDGSSYRVPANPIHMSGMERQTEYPVYPPGYGNGTPDILKETVAEETEEGSETESSPGVQPAMPLEGIRILDFSQFLSGPLCTLLLSDFGAEVIKIENPPLGDNTRYGPYIDQEVSSHYAMRNRGKKSIVLNMKNEEHRALFLKMAERADAVVDNYKPGTMEKFGITYELLREINPGIVFTSISGYGQTGPYASHAAFDQPVQAESGVMSITGEAGGTPVKCGASVGDVSGGLAACIGTLMGIFDAKRTGKGRRIDVSMMDALVFGLGLPFSSYLRTGVIPRPDGNRAGYAAPAGAYRCRDGVRLMITVDTDERWKNFCEALGKDSWLGKEEWTFAAGRKEDLSSIEREVAREFALHTSDELERKLLERNCVCGRVNDFSAVKAHPQVKHRQTFVTAVFPNGVAFQVPGNPIHMSGVERRTEYPAASLGYHTYEVLSRAADEATLHRLFDPVMESVRKAEKEIYDQS